MRHAFETAVNLRKGDAILSLKNRFPFRLGTTSYIIPAGLAENVAFLADKVDDIELVLFESHEISNLPDTDTVKRLREIAEQYDLTYTVHLPLDTWLGHADAAIRRPSVDKCLRVIEHTARLAPFAYILHFHGDRRGESPSPDMMRWQEGHRRAVERLVQIVPPEYLCVETLDYPYEFIEDIVIDYKLSVCMDIGHQLLCGVDPEGYLDRYLPHTRVLHLHGVENGHDHKSLAFLPGGLLTALINRLGKGPDIQRVLTIEIFDEGAFNQSMDLMRGLM
ncbi:MAG: xylose isomerase [Syntrophus sp. (in: bacteria)]|nr:xylose isomerase [Syntrophus sp. (in: bacteria)]